MSAGTGREDAAGPFGVPTLLDGAAAQARQTEAGAPPLGQTLEPLPLLGLLGPVGDVPHPALAPGGGPPHQALVHLLGLAVLAAGPVEVAGRQRLHVRQLPQLLRQVVGRPVLLRAAPAELLPGRPDSKLRLMLRYFPSKVQAMSSEVRSPRLFDMEVVAAAGGDGRPVADFLSPSM